MLSYISLEIMKIAIRISECVQPGMPAEEAAVWAALTMGAALCDADGSMMQSSPEEELRTFGKKLVQASSELDDVLENITKEKGDDK